uniref:SHSP domain-containing protein n=1 Tax=Chelydra serpentina TaxID=8475 RepID=A0A8C3SI46_CHESE
PGPPALRPAHPQTQRGREGSSKAQPGSSACQPFPEAAGPAPQASRARPRPLPSRARQSSQSLAEGKYQLSMDVSGFSPAELLVRLDGRKLTVTGKHEKKTESEAGVCSREYREICRETLLPEDVNVQDVLCSLSQDGQLCIEAPHLALPAAEGRAVPISICPGPLV